jgi:type IV secretion system protein TrbL
MRTNRLLLFALLLATASFAHAQTPAPDPTSVLAILKTSMAPAVTKLTAQAITWLGIFSTLQFAITNYHLFKSDADLQAHVAKTIGAIAWVGVCLYLINNGPEFLRGAGDQMMGLLGVDLPSPGTIMAATTGVAAAFGLTAIGVGAVPFVGGTAGMILTYVMFGVLLVGFYFAFKIFMLQLEIALIAMIAPLSFALLGLSTFRDQGMAPFKALVSLSYRIILITMILSAYGHVSGAVRDAMTSISKDSILGAGFGPAIDVIVSAIGAYLLLAYLMFKSDAIAATLAAGSTSMGTGDVAQAAAAGAALGAAISTGGAAAGALAGRAPQSMANFMSRMTGGSSISNASALGNGGDAPTMPSSPTSASASMSLGNTPGGSSSSSQLATHSAAGESGSRPAGTAITSGRYGVEPSGEGPAQTPRSAQAPDSTQSSTGGNQPAREDGGSTGTARPGSTTGHAETTRRHPSSDGSADVATIGGPLPSQMAASRATPAPDLSRHAKSLGSTLTDLGRHIKEQSAETRVSMNAHDQH